MPWSKGRGSWCEWYPQCPSHRPTWAPCVSPKITTANLHHCYISWRLWKMVILRHLNQVYKIHKHPLVLHGITTLHLCFRSGYGSIPINTIFRRMNIYLPAILMFTRGTRFWHTAIWVHSWHHIFDDTFCLGRAFPETVPREGGSWLLDSNADTMVNLRITMIKNKMILISMIQRHPLSYLFNANLK